MIRNLKIRIGQQLRFYSKMKTVVICIFLMLGGIVSVSAVPLTVTESNMQQQNRRVSGRIVDKSGEPVIGASVTQKGTTNGTFTNADGNFSLNLPENANLEVSYVGFVTHKLLPAHKVLSTLHWKKTQNF